MWVFTVKYNQSNGSVERFKARLVARGDSHISGVNYNETYAPVARFKSFRLLIALANFHDFDLEHLDINTAYLYCDVDTEIYMKQPPGCKIKSHENKFCRLQKSVYGLKQAGRIWNSVFHKFLLSCGYKRLISDECVYRLNLNNGKASFLLLYVDDLIVASNSNSVMQQLKNKIQSKFKIKLLGALRCFLNVEVIRDRKNKCTWLRLGLRSVVFGRVATIYRYRTVFSGTIPVVSATDGKNRQASEGWRKQSDFRLRQSFLLAETCIDHHDAPQMVRETKQHYWVRLLEHGSRSLNVFL
jgi:hypothetical protein